MIHIVKGLWEIQENTNGKICYLLGDYNINILNYSSHVHTAGFVDMMSSSGFLPLITRPTRVTATSATLIDNIFTNNLIEISHFLQGLFITDVSDHFPIFHVSRRMQSLMLMFICIKGYFPWKTRSSTMLLALQTGMKLTELQTPSRLLIYFTISLRNCIISISQYKYSNRKPWLSEGLKNSIRHKNKLYVKCKKVKSAFNEELYKTYKRKLQQVMKVAEKHYYHDLLVKYSNDMKQSWGIIKNIS